MFELKKETKTQTQKQTNPNNPKQKREELLYKQGTVTLMEKLYSLLFTSSLLPWIPDFIYHCH